MPTQTLLDAPAECFHSAASFSPGLRLPISSGTNGVRPWSSRATTTEVPSSADVDLMADDKIEATSTQDGDTP